MGPRISGEFLIHPKLKTRISGCLLIFGILFGTIMYMIRLRGYKTFFMLNSAAQKNFTADKYENAN